jgi:hypothetical protein
MNRDHVFARKTRQHSIVLQNSPPCAKELYEWLLRAAPAGKAIDIYLEDFQAEQAGRHHGKGYQLRWIKDCLKHLIELELVEVAYKISSKVFKLITWHPQQRNAESSQSSAQNLQANARSQPSNIDSAVPYYREIKETTDRPTHHPVSTNEQEGAIDLPTTPKSPEPETVSDRPQANEPQVIHKIEEAGFKPNIALIKIVRTTTAQIVLEAIEATQQYQRNLQQRNQPLKREPEAILVAAIKDEWKPIGSGTENEASVMPDGFNEWFQLAREVGLVGMSSAQADVTGHLPGVVCVRSVSGDWETFDHMRRLHSVVELQEVAEIKRSAIEFVPSPRLLAFQMEVKEAARSGAAIEQTGRDHRL